MFMYVKQTSNNVGTYNLGDCQTISINIYQAFIYLTILNTEISNRYKVKSKVKSFGYNKHIRF